jgi:serine protease Do
VIRDGKEVNIPVVLGERPKGRMGGAEQEVKPEEKASKTLGLTVQNLTADIAKQLGYKNDKGVVITSLAPGGPAEEAGLKTGDLIKEINKVSVQNMNDFNNAVKGLGSGDSIAMLIRRGDNTFYAGIQIP